MATEIHKESLQKEPIRVRLGQEFKPFGTLRDLNELDIEEFPNEGSFIYSNHFLVEGLGHGKVAIGPTNYLFHGRFLNLSKDMAEIVDLDKISGSIHVDIDEFDTTVTAQPDIICIVKVSNLQLHAKNAQFEVREELYEGALFDSFYSKDHPKKGRLLIDISVENLKKLTFRFDQNQAT